MVRQQNHAACAVHPVRHTANKRACVEREVKVAGKLEAWVLLACDARQLLPVPNTKDVSIFLASVVEVVETIAIVFTQLALFVDASDKREKVMLSTSTNGFYSHLAGTMRVLYMCTEVK